MLKCILQFTQIIIIYTIIILIIHIDAMLPINNPKLKFGTDLASNSIPVSSSNLANNAINSNQEDNWRSISPLTNSQIIFLNTVSNVQQPGIQSNNNMYNLPGNQTPRITAQNLRELDWTQIDRRTEEGKKCYI